MICGGKREGKGTKESVVLLGTMYRLLDTEPLLEGRFDHAICRVDRSIYVFGGKSEAAALQTCEKFSLSTMQWQSSTPLPFPCSDLACTHVPETGVFLHHTDFDSKFVLFSPSKETFVAVNFRFLSGIQAKSLVVCGNSLVILGEEFSVRCDVQSRRQEHRFSVSAPKLHPFPPPLLLNSTAYFPLSRSSLLTLDLVRCTSKVLSLPT